MPFVLGLHHGNAPVALREKLAVELTREGYGINHLKTRAGLAETVLLSTCNRIEVYAHSDHPQRACDAISQFWCESTGQTDLKTHLYYRQDEDAVRHLFRVASGLDSMVKGEHEILGQVKLAYQQAHMAGMTGKLLNVLFQRSLFVGKRVRTETAIAIGHSSVAGVAVSMAERIFENLSDRTVMIMGAGEAAEMTARHLLSRKVGTLMVSNRTLERAQMLAKAFGGKPLSLDQGLEQLAAADIVICSTASPQTIVTRDHVERIMWQRRGRSLFFIDIAVPRDVDPAVHQIENVYVYNIDDLQKIVDDNLAKRSGELTRAEAIVQEETGQFVRWLEASRAGVSGGLKHQTRSICS